VLEARGKESGTGCAEFVIHSRGSQPVKSNGFLETVESRSHLKRLRLCYCVEEMCITKWDMGA